MTSWYESNGARLSYRDIGSGRPVVFLHPTPFNSEFWLPLIERLDGVRAIVPDLRGHAGSELGAGLPVGEFERVPDAPAITMGQLASDVLALADFLKLDRPVYVGCSIGGYVLLELWRRAPARMRAIAIICSKPQPDAEANLARREATIAQARAGGLEAILDANIAGLVGATTRANHPEIAEQLRAQMRISAEALVAVQAGLAVRPDSTPTVATITVPVLAVTGGEDGTATAEEMGALKAAPGGCRHEVLANAGHTAAYEQPDAVAAIVRGWLGSLA
jgi:pimeloyl-ACP methyl ester carboxylesterase